MKDWPEYAYWFEDGVLHYQLFMSVQDYSVNPLKAPKAVLVYVYRTAYQWSSPWMTTEVDRTHALTCIPASEVPKEIRALHLLIGT